VFLNAGSVFGDDRVSWTFSIPIVARYRNSMRLPTGRSAECGCENGGGMLFGRDWPMSDDDRLRLWRSCSSLMVRGDDRWKNDLGGWSDHVYRFWELRYAGPKLADRQKKSIAKKKHRETRTVISLSGQNNISPRNGFEFRPTLCGNLSAPEKKIVIVGWVSNSEASDLVSMDRA
jgi:hypothetical protein